jgi:hypothetical protein
VKLKNYLNFSSAISLAIFAPINTETEIPSLCWIRQEERPEGYQIVRKLIILNLT